MVLSVVWASFDSQTLLFYFGNCKHIDSNKSINHNDYDRYDNPRGLSKDKDDNLTKPNGTKRG